MNKIKIVIAPNLKLPNIRIAEQIIRSIEHDNILIHTYEELEPQVKALADGRIAYEKFIENISKSRLALQPIGSWLYSLDPILKAIERIKKINSNVEVYCYKDLRSEMKLHEISAQIFILTAKSKILGKINLKDWKKTLKQRITLRNRILETEAYKIHEKAQGESLCTAGSSGFMLGEKLSQMGHKVELEDFMEEYYPTPLEELETKLSTGEVSDEETKVYIKEYLNYIENYILKSDNLDQAYYQWLYDNHPSIRSKISLEEIKFLSSIINKRF